MKIEFIPKDLSNRNIQQRLKSSLRKAQILRGTVAFWSISNTFFDKSLIDVLNHPLSFYCVDICSPTNFDAILSIEKELSQDKKGKTFFIHTKRISERENLLHSKVILMDMPNEEAELWVGSHNFTQYALKGINIESSMVIKLKKNELLYQEVLDFLNKLKNENKDNFFSEGLKYYFFKAAQDAANRKWIEEYLKKEEKLNFENLYYHRTIKIVGENLSNLDNTTIIVIGESLKEFQEIERYGKTIFIHAVENRSGQAYLYEAKLTARDILDDNYAKDVEYGKRRIGVQNHDIVNLSLDEQYISKSVLGKTGYYVNIEIKHKIAPNKIIKIYSWEDYSKMWIPKSLHEDGYNYDYLEAITYKNFKNSFMPKYLFIIKPMQKQQNITNERAESICHETEELTSDKAMKIKSLYIFKRRIFVILNTQNQLFI